MSSYKSNTSATLRLMHDLWLRVVLTTLICWTLFGRFGNEISLLACGMQCACLNTTVDCTTCDNSGNGISYLLYALSGGPINWTLGWRICCSVCIEMAVVTIKAFNVNFKCRNIFDFFFYLFARMDTHVSIKTSWLRECFFTDATLEGLCNELWNGWIRGLQRSLKFIIFDEIVLPLGTYLFSCMILHVLDQFTSLAERPSADRTLIEICVGVQLHVLQQQMGLFEAFPTVRTGKGIAFGMSSHV